MPEERIIKLMGKYPFDFAPEKLDKALRIIEKERVEESRSRLDSDILDNIQAAGYNSFSDEMNKRADTLEDNMRDEMLKVKMISEHMKVIYEIERMRRDNAK